jgi:hypothetical protein
VSNATTPSPVSQWKMNDNAASTTVVDAMGISNGTAQQNTSVLHTTGKIDGALSFNGSSDYINCGSDSSLNITGEISISVWIYAGAIPDDALWVICGRQYDGDTSGFGLILDGRLNPDSQTAPRRHIHFQIGDGSYHVTNVNAIVPTSEWVHIVATRKANENAVVYYNGVSQSLTSAAWTGNITYSQSFKIGNQQGFSRFFTGSIDDLRIYDFALTSDQVSYLYNSGHGTENENPLIQSYSGSEHTQGSYSLKVVAAQTNSLNKTLTKTLSVHSDLTGVGKLRISDYALRTGSNYKIGLHDSGGTTTEYTPNIGTSNTWQTDYIDLSAVSDANKDDIDSIIITVTNADSANTMYLDYFGIYCGGGGGGSYTWAN